MLYFVLSWSMQAFDWVKLTHASELSHLNITNANFFMHAFEISKIDQHYVKIPRKTHGYCKFKLASLSEMIC